MDEIKKYRIVVNRKPGGRYEYFPEVYKSNSMSDDKRWINTMMPIEIRSFFDKQECIDHINDLKEEDAVRNGKYIVEIIDM